MQENKFEYINLYQVGMWYSNISSLDTQDLSTKLYTIKNNMPSVNKSNEGGYQTKNNLHLNAGFFPLVEILNKIGFKLFSNIKIASLWGNISSFGNYNSIHNHGIENNKFSGVVYLKTPKNSGEVTFLTLVDPHKYTRYFPKEKDIIIFPSNLLHSVEPNLSQEDRISIAFNYE